MLLIHESALRRMRGGGLGAVTSAVATPTAAIARVFPQGLTAQYASTGPGGGTSQANGQASVQLIQQAASSRFIPWENTLSHTQPWAFTCSGSTPAQASARKVTSITGTGLKTAAFVDPEPISKGILAIASLFTGLFAGLFKEYHAERWAAVCGAVPAANQMLQQIDQALASGQMTPDQARAQYESLQTQFSSAMHVKSYARPNLVWVFDMAMQTAIAARKLDLQNGVLTGGVTAPWAKPSVAGIAASLGISSSALPWLVLGGAALLALAL